MGPSGSSKTTLLDVLAARKTVGTLTGTLLFGGHRATQSFLRRYIGYVEQFGESCARTCLVIAHCTTTSQSGAVAESLPWSPKIHYGPLDGRPSLVFHFFSRLSKCLSPTPTQHCLFLTVLASITATKGGSWLSPLPFYTIETGGFMGVQMRAHMRRIL